MTERVLALDVSFRNCGYALVSGFGEIIEHGCIHTDSGRRDRLHLKRQTGESVAAHNARVCGFLARELDDKRRWLQPTRIIAEIPHGGAQGARANACMGMALGIVTSVFRNCECVWVRPQRTKGNAEAACRAEWPSHAWPATKGDSEHIFDALSAYLIWREKETEQ